MNELSERGLITSVFPPSFSAFLLNFLTKDEMLLRGFSPVISGATASPQPPQPPHTHLSQMSDSVLTHNMLILAGSGRLPAQLYFSTHLAYTGGRCEDRWARGSSLREQYIFVPALRPEKVTNSECLSSSVCI